MCGGLLLWKTLGRLIKKSLIRAIQERLKIKQVVLANGPVDSIEPNYLAVLPYWKGKRVPAILRFSVEDIQIYWSENVSTPSCKTPRYAMVRRVEPQCLQR